MNFKPNFWKIIIAIVFALVAGFAGGLTGSGFKILSALILAVPVFVVVYLISSLFEKKKVSQK